MALLLVFAVAVLFGPASCDSECFRAVFGDCRINAADNCDRLRAAYECGAEKALECSMGFADAARDVSGALDELCTGPLRSDFLRQKQCFIEALDLDRCFDLIYNRTSYIETPEDFVKMNKEGCRNLDVYSRCVVKKVKDKCVDISTFHHLFDPLQRLAQGLCTETILPAGDSWGLLSVFSIAVLSFRNV